VVAGDRACAKALRPLHASTASAVAPPCPEAIDTILDQEEGTTHSQDELRGYAERVRNRALARVFGDLREAAADLQKTVDLLKRAEELAKEDELLRRRQAALGDEL
jgi:hypothetical protein